MNKRQLALTTTDPKVLDELSRDENWLVRSWVAENLNTKQETLDYLSKDECWYVRWRVAQNSNTMPETLKQIAIVEDNETVKYVIKNNPNCSEETWNYLSALEILETLPQVSI